LTWIWVNCLLKENVLLALTFPNLIRSEMCIHNKDKVDQTWQLSLKTTAHVLKLWKKQMNHGINLQDSVF